MARVIDLKRTVLFASAALLSLASPLAMTQDDGTASSQGASPTASERSGDGVGAGGGGAARAETEPGVGTDAGAAPDLAGMTVSELRDMPVTTSDGERVGRIGDFVLTDNNRLGEAVIDVGGFLGINRKAVAVDLATLAMSRSAEGSPGERHLVLNLTRRELEALPAWEKESGGAQRD